MKFSAFLLVSVATMLLFATAIDIEEVEFEMSMCERFSRYTKYFNESSDDAEELFKENCQMAYQQNEAFKQQLTSFVSTPNQFFGQKFEDVVKVVAGTYKREMRARPAPFAAAKSFYPAAPKFKNWCYLHGEVRDQDQCGGCWAFASIAVIEALVQRVRGLKWFLSEQMLIDCDTMNGGCNGGWPTDALNFVQKNGVSSNSYSYKNAEGVCQMRSFRRMVEARSFVKVVEEELNGNEELLKRIVNAKGPVVVVMHINELILGYGGGVYIDDLCPKDDVNHAVVICGYGEDPEYGPYWIVRNSWSAFWGERGYIRISRGRNTCGIATTYAMYAEM